MIMEIHKDQILFFIIGLLEAGILQDVIMIDFFENIANFEKLMKIFRKISKFL